MQSPITGDVCCTSVPLVKLLQRNVGNRNFAIFQLECDVAETTSSARRQLLMRYTVQEQVRERFR